MYNLKRRSGIRRWFNKNSVWMFLSGIFIGGFIIGFLICTAVMKVSASSDEGVSKISGIKQTATEEKADVQHEVQKKIEWVEFEATAYCSCSKCCEEWALNRPTDENGNEIVCGAAGVKLIEGISISSDWSVLPKGAKVEIQGMGYYIVQDQGAAIRGNKIDVYFENHKNALEFGRKKVMLRIVEEGDVK